MSKHFVSTIMDGTPNYISNLIHFIKYVLETHSNVSDYGRLYSSIIITFRPQGMTPGYPRPPLRRLYCKVVESPKRQTETRWTRPLNRNIHRQTEPLTTPKRQTCPYTLPSNVIHKCYILIFHRLIINDRSHRITLSSKSRLLIVTNSRSHTIVVVFVEKLNSQHGLFLR